MRLLGVAGHEQCLEGVEVFSRLRCVLVTNVDLGGCLCEEPMLGMRFVTLITFLSCGYIYSSWLPGLTLVQG